MFRCSGVPPFQVSTLSSLAIEEPATVFLSVSCPFSCSCAKAGKTNMATKVRYFQFLSRNARNLVLIRRGFQSVKYGQVSRSNNGIMTALACSRNNRYSLQNPCFPAGGELSSVFKLMLHRRPAILFVNSPLDPLDSCCNFKLLAGERFFVIVISAVKLFWYRRKIRVRCITR